MQRLGARLSLSVLGSGFSSTSCCSSLATLLFCSRSIYYKPAGRVLETRQDRAALLLQDLKLLADEYRSQCASVVNFFHDPKNLAHVFAGAKPPTPAEPDPPCLTYQQLEELAADGTTLTYSSPEISASMRMLAHYILCSVLVEVNVKSLLTLAKPSASFAFRDLIHHIGDKDLLDSILTSLAPYYTLHETGPPASFHEFLAGLDPAVLHDLSASFATDPSSFNSLPIMRQLFMYFKSGDSLSFEDADCVRGGPHNRYCTFASPTVDDSCYIKQFESIFAQYSPGNHLDTLLSICKVLLQPGASVPSPATLGYLLDKFGDIGLLHYQSLVFSVLPKYTHRATALANVESQPAPLGAMHFEHLVLSLPDFLAHLFKYVTRRGDVATFKQLLAFWRLSSIIIQEKTLNRSNVSAMLSMSRFTKSRDRYDNVEPLVFATDEPLFVLLDTLYTCIESCIELGQFQYIDLLMNKLLLHSVEPSSALEMCASHAMELDNPHSTPNHKVLVALSFGSDISKSVNIALNRLLQNASYSLIISNPYTPKQLAERLYNKRLYKLLLRASDLSNDMGRILWLMPHLDAYVQKSLLDSDPLHCVHVENIKQYIRDPSSVDENFLSQDKTAPVDMALISDIYRVLTKFSLEGKLLAYDKLLSFNQTISFKEIDA